MIVPVDDRPYGDPKDFLPPDVHALCNPIPSGAGRTCDLLLTDRIWQG